MCAERGVCYVAYGEAACREARLSIQSLRLFNDLPVTVIGEPVTGAEHIEFKQVDPGGRWAKLNLNLLTTYKLTAYIDADAWPMADISAGFELVADGWDMAMTASTNQGRDLFWHIKEKERAITLAELSYDVLGLQAGVIFIGKSQNTARLFAAWRCEWLRWKDQDQAALMRALATVPARVWMLGKSWNGGSGISHRWGAVREHESPSGL